MNSEILSDVEPRFIMWQFDTGEGFNHHRLAISNIGFVIVGRTTPNLVEGSSKATTGTVRACVWARLRSNVSEIWDTPCRFYLNQLLNTDCGQGKDAAHGQRMIMKTIYFIYARKKRRVLNSKRINIGHEE